jgi:thymidylate kinase
MTGKGRVAAIEGPCCAGKTTLGRALTAALSDLTVVRVPCYADHVGGSRFLPRPVPASVSEDAAALAALLAVEADRSAYAHAQPYDLALVDRSVYTLLAHRYTLERRTGLGLFEPAWQLLARSDLPLWPDLVLYLDLPQEAIEDRNQGKFEDGNIFIDPDYNAGFRAFFEKLDADLPAIVWIDATLTPVELCGIAERQVRALLSGQASPLARPERELPPRH